MEEVKKCTKCGEVKSTTEFNKDATKKDGLRSDCKSCRKKHYEANAEAIREYQKTHYEANAEAIRERQKNYREANAEAIREQKKKYQKANAEAIREQQKKYKKEKLKTDPLFKFMHQIKNLVSNSLKRAGARKKSRTEQLLGCTIAEFKLHLERQFVDGMSWENRHEWHIDHIMPMASAITQEDAERLQHYTNLRPIWAVLNRSQGARGYKGTRAKTKKETKHGKSIK